MKKLSIDRFDGKYAICEDDDRRVFAIERSEIPKEAKRGDVLSISDEREITIDEQETKARKKRIKKLQDSLWK